MISGAARIAAPLRKWSTVFAVYLQDVLTYRSQTVIWMMTDTVPAVLMPIVWLASYHGRATIGGFSPGAMVTYYLVMLCLTHLMVSHVMWDMATEIREGRFSIFLTRPMSYMSYQYAGSLSWRLLRGVLFVPILAICLALFWRYLRWEGYHLGWSFWAAVAGGHLLSFLIGYALGLLALIFTEVRGLFLFYYMPLSFLSGEVVPLSLLPDWAEAAARLLPFRYTLAFAAEIFLNQLSRTEIAAGFGWMALWMAVWIGIARVLWRVGLRQYTGVGM